MNTTQDTNHMIVDELSARRDVKNLIEGTNMVLVNSCFFSNATGTIGYVLTKDIIMGYTMGFLGVVKGINQREDEVSIAKWGSKLSRAEAEYHFGTQENYKYK